MSKLSDLRARFGPGAVDARQALEAKRVMATRELREAMGITRTFAIIRGREVHVARLDMEERAVREWWMPQRSTLRLSLSSLSVEEDSALRRHLVSIQESAQPIPLIAMERFTSGAVNRTWSFADAILVQLKFMPQDRIVTTEWSFGTYKTS